VLLDAAILRHLYDRRCVSPHRIVCDGASCVSVVFSDSSDVGFGMWKYCSPSFCTLHPFSSNSISECFPSSASKSLAMCEIKRGTWPYNCCDTFKMNYTLFSNGFDCGDISIRTTRSCSHQSILNLDIFSAMFFALYLRLNYRIK
jgi:hypothetical protein